MAATSKQLDELLVAGYLRMEAKSGQIEISEDILNICLIWYHIELYFFKTGDRSKISDDGTIIASIGAEDKFEYQPNSCYGSVIMPSQSDKDIEYKYKVKIVKGDPVRHICIGIDDGMSS